MPRLRGVELQPELPQPVPKLSQKPLGFNPVLEPHHQVVGGRPMTAPSGKPVTVRFDLDTLCGPPILQKGYLSSLQCVSGVPK